MTIKESALKQIKVHIKNLNDEGFECSIVSEKPYNYESTAIKNKLKFKVQVYFGKKGLKTVIQGNEASEEYIEVKSIVTGNYSLNLTNNQETNYEEYIGTDESGKGDFFGPLVIAGVYVDKNDQDFLSSLGVRDSKKLTDTQINSLAYSIKKKMHDKISVVKINPEKYNLLYQDFQNVNKLLNWAHSKVIHNLLEKYESPNVIIDQFAKTPIDISLKNKFSHINFVQMPKAEKYLGVAAASIIARNALNKWFENKRDEGFNVLKGASKEVESAAKSILKSSNENVLSNLVKLHFKTAKKIFKE